MSANSPWTQHTFNYTAPNVNTATLAFAFRNDPNYWYLDDVSVTNSSGGQLLSNGGFESGSLPPWVYCNPLNSGTLSSVLTGTVHTGSYAYKAGAVGASDYVSQTFNVQPNYIYTVTFWLHSLGTSNVFAWITIFN